MYNSKKLREKICSYIARDGVTFDLRETLDSTSTELRKTAASGVPEGYVLASLTQTAGRGRCGKSFYSQFGGVYLSLLLRPRNFDICAKYLTPCAAVAVAEAVERVTGIRLGIKWVNDLFYKDKKVCGILTEAVSSSGGTVPDSVIVGIGVNLFASRGGFGELSDTAAALFTSEEYSDEIYCKLCAEIVSVFFEKYEHLDPSLLYEEYKRRFILAGRDIRVIKNGESLKARCIDVKRDFSLEVRYIGGVTEALSSGEISIIPL